MNEPGMGVLLDQETMRARANDGYPSWARDHWETFRESLTGEYRGEDFPCYFGRESVRAGDPLYTVVPSLTDPDALLALRDTLVEYLERNENHSERASLVAFFAPPDRKFSEGDYHDALWHILQFLHVHDPEPWPADIPTDPDDPYWEFSFAGEPMFPTCRAPFYDTYRSRYCPVGLEVTFQPRALFKSMGVTADTEAGQRARDVIQENLESYDSVCPHADLGDWGVEGDREWPQYMLREDDDEAPDECPIAVSRDHPKVAPSIDPGVAREGGQ